MKKALIIISVILALTLALLTTTCTGAKTVAKPKLTLASNYVTEDKTARKIKVTWAKIKSAKAYQIQRSRYKDFKTVASTVNTSRTSRTYSLSNSSNFSKDYYIRVRTKQNNGKFGAWSNAVKAKGITIDEATTEEEKQELKVPVPCLTKHERTDRSCTIRIEWDAIEGANGYEVQRSIYSDFREHEDTVLKKTTNTYYQCSTSGQAPYYFPAKQTYYLRVRAVAEDGTASKWSGTVVARGSYTLE